MNLGIVLQECGNPAAAAEAHKEAIRLDPHLAPAHYNLALARLGLGQVADAEAGFRAALLAKPEFPEAWDEATLAAADTELTGIDDYFRACNALLAEADVLWTKPSEMTFFAALGLPLVLAPPVGVQEVYNRRWAIEAGAAVEQRETRAAGDWLAEWLEDGTLAGAAWNGFTRLPTRGLFRILRALEREPAIRSEGRSPEAPSAGASATRSSGS